MKGSAFASDLLLHLFQNTAIAGIGSAGGLQPSWPAGDLYCSLHTADPGPAGVQSTNETGYGSYARVAVARSAAGWTIIGNQAANTALVQFPQCTGGSSTITHFGVGTTFAGPGLLLYSGPLITTFYGFTGKASNDTLTAPGHALAINDTVQVITMPDGTLPGGTATSTTYFVKTVAGNDITLSATLGGATLDLTTDGEGSIGKIQILAVSNLVTPQFGVGALVASIEF